LHCAVLSHFIFASSPPAFHDAAFYAELFSPFSILADYASLQMLLFHYIALIAILLRQPRFIITLYAATPPPLTPTRYAPYAADVFPPAIIAAATLFQRISPFR